MNIVIFIGCFKNPWGCTLESFILGGYSFVYHFERNVTPFEQIIYDQLCHYLNENNLLCRHQSGFRSLHSTATVTALIEATDNWCLNIVRGFINAAVLRRPSILWNTLFFFQKYKLMVFRVPHTNSSTLI